jgi:predicted aconitase
MAYGDTGVVIYANSVLGARSNFEGGPSALAAGLTGLTPRYGYHLPEHRRASLLIDVGHTPEELTDWGALGGIVGRMTNDYWRVPALRGIDRVPTSDEMKHFGAAMASYGSVALFHMIGITPEAERLSDVADPGMSPEAAITRHDIVAFRQAYAREVDRVDVVVFSSPQLSLLEMRTDWA